MFSNFNLMSLQVRLLARREERRTGDSDGRPRSSRSQGRRSVGKDGEVVQLYENHTSASDYRGRVFVSHPPHSKEKSNTYLGDSPSIVYPRPMHESCTEVPAPELWIRSCSGGDRGRYVPWVLVLPTPLQLLGNAEPRASSTSLTCSLVSHSFRRVCQATACDGLEARLPRRYLGPVSPGGRT
jgi:hypothetical protein